MLALIAPNSINPNTTLSLIKLSVRNLYSAKDQLESDSEPADLNNINTKNPVKIIGIIRKSETFSHPNPLNLITEPSATPEINPPITGGPIVLPICAPVKCIDKANPFLSGYRAAKVPKAGACQKLVPNPIRITESIISA